MSCLMISKNQMTEEGIKQENGTIKRKQINTDEGSWEKKEINPSDYIIQQLAFN